MLVACPLSVDPLTSGLHNHVPNFACESSISVENLVRSDGFMLLAFTGIREETAAFRPVDDGALCDAEIAAGNGVLIWVVWLSKVASRSAAGY